jgi:hypothetical protein
MSIRNKVEYVQRQKQTRPHKCHWPGCQANCKPAFWGCRKHWFTLPQRLRLKIWETYKIGQEVSMTPSKAYLKAAEEAQKWIAGYLFAQQLGEKDNADEERNSAVVDKGRDQGGKNAGKTRVLRKGDRRRGG